MKLAEMMVNRRILKIAALLLGGYIFFSAGLVGQAIMVIVVLAVVAAWKRARGEEAVLRASEARLRIAERDAAATP